MPLPFILGGLALAAAGYGTKKGVDAKRKNKKAERIIEDAKEDFEEAQNRLNKEGQELNKDLELFAKYKLNVFTTQINQMIKLIKKCKSARSKLSNEKYIFSTEEIKKLELAVTNSLEITEGLSKGITSGVLTALGAYGGVGMLASASTGTAIASLSGAAATNATLAWLGGGSLAAGGFGVAGGMAVLSGLVAGPAIAIVGLVMDSKAEENLTKAREFEAEVEMKIEKINESIAELKITKDRLKELQDIIQELEERFNRVYKEAKKLSGFLNLFNKSKLCNSRELDELLKIGKSLKLALEISLLDKDGNNSKNFRTEIERIEI